MCARRTKIINQVCKAMASTIQPSCPPLFIICWIVLGSILTLLGIVYSTMKSERDRAICFLVSLTVCVFMTITVVIWWPVRPVEVDCVLESDDYGELSQTVSISDKPETEETFV